MRNSRPGRPLHPIAEGLERRELMTSGRSLQPIAIILGAAIPADATVRIAASPPGSASARPTFSPQYHGPHRAELNLTNASAVIRPGRTLTLSASVVRKIIGRPKDASQSSFFVFGLDRGSSQSVALFPHRPGIRFDSVVVATITPKGIGGYVLDVARNNAQTDLTAANVRIFGRTIRVTIPDGLPPQPAGSLPPSRTRFAVWVRDHIEHTLADIEDGVASFLPKNATSRAGVIRTK